jgi:MFS family permease
MASEGATMTFALLMAGTILSVWLAGRLAQRRGRSFRTWAWVGAIIGPFALPLLYLFPNLHRRNGDALNDASGER